MKTITAPTAGRITEPLSFSKGWQRVVKGKPDGKPYRSDYAAVNYETNKNFRYSPNPKKWLLPIEFQLNGYGDCKDFATYKFYWLNLPKYIAVGGLKEDNQPHAVCVVYAPDREEWVVLDNRTDDIVSWDEFLKVFTPLYLCDEAGVYL